MQSVCHFVRRATWGSGQDSSGSCLFRIFSPGWFWTHQSPSAMFRPQPMYHGDSQYNGGAEGGSATQSQQQQYNGQIQQQTGLSYQPQVAMPPIRRFSTEADIHHAAPLQLDDQPPSTYREENPTERGYREEQQGLNTALPPYRAPPHLYHPRDRLGR